MCGGFSGDNEAAMEKVGEILDEQSQRRLTGQAPLPTDLQNWQPQVIVSSEDGDDDKE